MDWEDDEELRPGERRILELLSENYYTRGALARDLDYNPDTVSGYLNTLRRLGYVEYYHEESGLWTLADGVATD